MLASALLRDKTKPEYVGLMQVGETPNTDTRPSRAPTFKERGFSFIPIRQAHLDFMSFCYGRPAPPLAECEGRAMVDDRYLPLGVALIHHEPNGVHTAHAHFGVWLKVYPKDILRSMSDMCDGLRSRGITILHAAADESIEGSDTLVKWLRGEKLDVRHETGPIYRIDLNRALI